MSEFKGFVGPAYTAADPDQDIEELINYYPEGTDTEGAKARWALLGTPGTLAVASTQAATVRGMWVLPGGLQALVVTGTGLYLLTVVSFATASAPAVFTTTTISTVIITGGVTPVSIRDNGTVAVIVDGTSSGYVYNIATQILTKIVDAAFYGADRVCFFDGWFLFNKPGTRIFYTSPLYWNGVTAFDSTYFALKDVETDLLVSIQENLRELWLIGEQTTEIWYDAGGATFPLARLEGAMLQIGISAKHSVSRFNTGLIWLARSERGENVVVKTTGFLYSVCSTRAVETAIASYPVVNDAIGYVYQEAGHEFYVLNFPTADVTWVYDGSMDKWHKRAYRDASTGVLHRHLSNCYINFQNQRLVGDYLTGQIHSMSRSYFTDNGVPLVSLRRSPHVWDGENRERVYHDQLQVQFRSGVGTQTGQGVAPQVLMRFSDDSGFTWSVERPTHLGAAGETKNRAIWRRLGSSRDRVYEVKVTDPVNRDIVGASLYLS